MIYLMIVMMRNRVLHQYYDILDSSNDEE